MKLRHVIAGLSVAVTLGAGGAFAQVAQPAEPTAAAPPQDMPWSQRFTQSVESGSGWADSDTRAALSWRPTARWGVTLNVRDGDRASVASQDEASVGAFFQFTPRLRVGGEVSVASPRAGPLANPRLQGQAGSEEPSAGVKLESAFRF